MSAYVGIVSTRHHAFERYGVIMSGGTWVRKEIY